MQGHRSSIGSLTEVLEFDLGSSSSNPDIERQMFWSNMMNHGENDLSDLIQPSENPVDSPRNFIGREGKKKMSSKWDLGEPSSSNAQNEQDSMFFYNNVNTDTNDELNLNPVSGQSSSNKRKGIEEDSGQSSNNGVSLSLSSSSANVNITGHSPLEEHGRPRDTWQRNVRPRINSPLLQDLLPLNLNFPSTQNLDLSSAHPQTPPIGTYVSDLQQNAQSSSSVVPRVTNEALHDEGIMRHIGSRHLVQNPRTRTLTRSVPRNDASSSSRASLGSGVNPAPVPTRPPNRNHNSQYIRRLTELIQLSLLSSESGGPVGSHSTLPVNASGSSQEAVVLNGANNEGNRRTYPRSALLMQRQGEGRGRLVSEIRNMLDLMRRGEGIRFEDAMMLEHTLLSGAEDLHDRHRDMRLDVDNMSYEELLALEEHIGDVNIGLSEDTISNCLKQRKFVSIETESQSEAEPCCICREEYIDGEDLGILECGHDFHTDCVKQWLMKKNLCPICKTTAMTKP